MSEEKGSSEEKDGLFGKYTKHIDEEGKVTGYSENKEGLFTDYTEHTDTSGSVTGRSEEKQGLFDDYVEHRDASGNVTGYSEKKKGMFDDYTQHTDPSGNVTGWSKQEKGLFDDYTRHHGSSHQSTDYREEAQSSDRKSSGYSGGGSSGSDGAGAAGAVVLLLPLLAVVGVFWLLYGIFKSILNPQERKKAIFAICILLVIIAIPFGLSIYYKWNDNTRPYTKITTINGWEINCIDKKDSRYCVAGKGKLSILRDPGEKGLAIYLSTPLLNASGRVKSLSIDNAPSISLHDAWNNQQKAIDIVHKILKGKVVKTNYKDVTGKSESTIIQIGNFSEVYSKFEQTFKEWFKMKPPN